MQRDRRRTDWHQWVDRQHSHRVGCGAVEPIRTRLNLQVNIAYVVYGIEYVPSDIDAEAPATAGLGVLRVDRAHVPFIECDLSMRSSHEQLCEGPGQDHTVQKHEA